ncbi:MAG: radical SAM protein [Candidatus Korarchaeum sp.]|nr:radical SAM protein [Candidatus Korarchaeum sp.]
MEGGERPEWIVWIVTGQCNLSCPYCYATYYQGEQPLKGEVLRKVLEDARSTGIEYINYTGGEPLIRDDMLNIIKETVDLGIEVSLFTNLTLMREEVASELSKREVFVMTSLDGPRDVYEAVKGIGTWKRFLRGIKSLKKFNLLFHVNITVSKFNYDRIGEALRLAVELGAESVSLIPSMAFGRALKTRSFIEGEELLKSLTQAEKVAEELGIEVSVWCVPFLTSLRGFKNLHCGNCRGWKEMDISPSGKVLICDVMGVEVADVLEDRIMGSWLKLSTHPSYLKVRMMPEGCCGDEKCSGGCYARAYNLWGELPAPDPLCPKVRSGRIIEAFFNSKS